MDASDKRSVTIFLCGDVMTGRGIDQILPHPSPPRIYEACVTDARSYVQLAEEVNGPMPRAVEFSYIWGDALAELRRAAPDARIINLETSVTRSEQPWPKGINYRMHPDNIGCLTVAAIDVCVLANNHVLDYGYPGLIETVETLQRAGLKAAGAGRSLEEARRPAVAEAAGDFRVVVHGFASETSGVPPIWAASDKCPGVNFLSDFSDATAAAIGQVVRALKRTGDVTIASIHWGSNWGYQVPREQVRFAHRLIDGGVDVVHGHSSHHPRPIEVYGNRLILYGCGDFINDYEGICGYEKYRADLALMYFPSFNSDGALLQLRMVPMQIRKFRLNRAAPQDALWLRDTLARISADFGASVDIQDGSLFLRWEEAQHDPASTSRAPARTSTDMEKRDEAKGA
jgi:poly-gamma-glutamate synthesis protein (capsule biosynthesis protein)